MPNTLFDNDGKYSCFYCGNSGTATDKSIIFRTAKLEVRLCAECYVKCCKFCKEPTLLENCPGHSIKAKEGNRFTQDKNFMKETTFDVE